MKAQLWDFSPNAARSSLMQTARLAAAYSPAQHAIDVEFRKMLIQNRIGLFSELTAMDWFCGAGGSSQGLHAVPGLRLSRAANHWKKAIATHQFNFPEADHWRGDIRDAPVERWPVCDIFWASPECPNWSSAKGLKQDYQHSLQSELFDPREGDVAEQEKRDAEERSRALMDEVPGYLAGVMRRGKRVLAGVVENVIEVRGWDQWKRWLGEFHKLGYLTRVIALNSMHAQSAVTPFAPQSRDRLYVAYWAKELGRTPDFDKWLRPMAYCPTHGLVQARQWFKKPGADMGRYRAQYLYLCPRLDCRNTIVEPPVVPAAAAIDWSDLGTPIGTRRHKGRPGLAPNTMARIAVGMQRYRIRRSVGAPLVAPTGGTWRDSASPVTDPFPSRTTTENDGIAVPAPFLALLRSDRARTIGVHEPTATVVADGSNHALAVPPGTFAPFIAELRGGASDARPVADPLGTVTASGNHHFLTTPPLMDQILAAIMVPYNGRGNALSANGPVGVVPTKDRWSLAQPIETPDILEVLFRMLKPAEIAGVMAFLNDYTVLGTRREQVRQYGNAVTPPAAEVILNALVEAISGTEFDRWPFGSPFPATMPA